MSELEYPYGCHWSDEFPKTRTFFRKIVLLHFAVPSCHPSTLIDLSNTSLVKKTFCRDSLHDLTGLEYPYGCHWSDGFLKISGPFFVKSCSRDFGAPSCNRSTFLDLANTAQANKRSVKTICMVCESYSTVRGVTCPMNFKKLRPFIEESWSRVFYAPSCHPIPFIDLAITDLANIHSVKSI